MKTFACLALSFSTYRFVYISIERGKNSLTESQSSFAATIKRSERQREGERERERERERGRERERE